MIAPGRVQLQTTLLNQLTESVRRSLAPNLPRIALDREQFTRKARREIEPWFHWAVLDLLQTNGVPMRANRVLERAAGLAAQCHAILLEKRLTPAECGDTSYDIGIGLLEGEGCYFVTDTRVRITVRNHALATLARMQIYPADQVANLFREAFMQVAYCCDVGEAARR